MVSMKGRSWKCHESQSPCPQEDLEEEEVADAFSFPLREFRDPRSLSPSGLPSSQDLRSFSPLPECPPSTFVEEPPQSVEVGGTAPPVSTGAGQAACPRPPPPTSPDPRDNPVLYDDPVHRTSPAPLPPSMTFSESGSPTESCPISTEERLIKTNPIWFLPDLHRVGAVHLLQAKDEGTFLVRQSSQKNTLAISVRLPPEKGPHVQHYLVEIQPPGTYALEASDYKFPTLPALLAFYTKCCDELPVHLNLPKCVQDAKTRHELASIALLGQEFWGTTMASPLSTPIEDKSLVILSPVVRPNDISFSSFGKGGLNHSGPFLSTSGSPLTSLGSHLGGSTSSLTPIRPAPPIPSIDRSNLNLNLSSEDNPPHVPSFRSPGTSAANTKPSPPPRTSPPNGQTKPQPPMRSNPQSPSSNITVTTTLTFNVNPIKGFQLPQGVSPTSSNDETIQLHVSSLEISPCSSASTNGKDGLKLHFRAPYSSSPPLIPLSEESIDRGKVKMRRSKKKESSHYRETNVLFECHRSSLADKISDYEDLWTSPPADNNNGGFFSPSVESTRVGPFKTRTDVSKSMGDLSDVMRRDGGPSLRTSEESLEESRQASSPFYVEPLDALRERANEAMNIYGESRRENRPRIRKCSRKVTANRHSDSNIEIRSRRARNILARIEDNHLEDHLSSSQEEDLERAKNVINNNYNRRCKPIAPPKVSPLGMNHPPSHNWVDASWEFLSYVGNSTTDSETALIPGDLTVQSLIKQKLPNLKLHDIPSNESPSLHLVQQLSRYSLYDNVRENSIRNGSTNHYIASSISDSGTEFSEPWDSRKWDTILQNDGDSLRHDTVDDSDSLVQVTGESESNEDSLSVAPTVSLSQRTNFDTNIKSKILSPQMLAIRHRKDAESGASIRKYALSLGCDTKTTFSQAICNFLTCTLEGNEREASVVVRNVRQFMSGMKNYLVTSGEGQFQEIVTKERSNLKSNEFLNLDAILEDVLVRLVLRPLWTHINQLYIDALTLNGSIQTLADNIDFAKTLPYFKLGIRANLEPPKGEALIAIQLLLTKMQHVYAPREKLAHLLGLISHIYHAMYENGTCDSATGDADDLVPMIMWILIHAQVVGAEVEADYIQGLLLPSSASGEASYYLNAFQSAVHSLKNLDKNQSPNHSPGDSLHSINQEFITDQAVLRIVIPDEKNGSIITRTLPIRPGSTTRELWRMLAHKLRVTNPQDFALYKLVDGHEFLLGDNECPQKVRKEHMLKGSNCMIAFKRIEAKIAWPLNN